MHARPTILILAALAGTAYGQSMTTGAIEGRVTDKGTKEPLVGVTVIAAGATPEPQTALTDGDGVYKITDLLPGDYAVTFYIDNNGNGTYQSGTDTLVDTQYICNGAPPPPSWSSPSRRS